MMHKTSKLKLDLNKTSCHIYKLKLVIYNKGHLPLVRKSNLKTSP